MIVCYQYKSEYKDGSVINLNLRPNDKCNGESFVEDAGLNDAVYFTCVAVWKIKKGHEISF